jgi:hypothetical protein
MTTVTIAPASSPMGEVSDVRIQSSNDWQATGPEQICADFCQLSVHLDHSVPFGECRISNLRVFNGRLSRDFQNAFLKRTLIN